MVLHTFPECNLENLYCIFRKFNLETFGCFHIILIGDFDFLYLFLKISGEMTLILREWQSRNFYYAQNIDSLFLGTM